VWLHGVEMAWSFLPVSEGDEILAAQYNEIRSAIDERAEAINLSLGGTLPATVSQGDSFQAEQINDLRRALEAVLDWPYDDQRNIGYCDYFLDRPGAESPQHWNWNDYVAYGNLAWEPDWVRVPNRVSGVATTYGDLHTGDPICVEHVNQFYDYLNGPMNSPGVKGAALGMDKEKGWWLTKESNVSYADCLAQAPTLHLPSPYAYAGQYYLDAVPPYWAVHEAFFGFNLAPIRDGMSAEDLFLWFGLGPGPNAPVDFDLRVYAGNPLYDTPDVGDWACGGQFCGSHTVTAGPHPDWRWISVPAVDALYTPTDPSFYQFRFTSDHLEDGIDPDIGSDNFERGDIYAVDAIFNQAPILAMKFSNLSYYNY